MKKTVTISIILILSLCNVYSRENSHEHYFYHNGINIPLGVTQRSITEVQPSDILFWVGTGSNEAIFAVNWCDTSVAFAWGYRFSSDSVLVSTMMNDIAAADPRLTITTGTWGIADIAFTDLYYSLSLVGAFWMYNVNGTSAALGYNQQYIHHEDFVEWGDESCGTADENYQYVWTTTIVPVYNPNPTDDIFDGVVESSGCQAIFCEDPAILGWATGCSITRGYQDIVQHNLAASYGNESDAVGAVTTSTTTVVSLGDSGVAVLTFDIPITNGEGYDFAVFENGLNDVFLELAFVEASSDGVHYHRFPATSNTPADVQVSNAGSIDATHLHNLAGKYRVGWGTPFDLEELSGYDDLDINNITHIKLVDVIGTIDPKYASFDSHGHIINDPYPTPFASSGFDLAGVAVLNGWTTSLSSYGNQQPTIEAYPNPCTNYIFIGNNAGEKISLYNTYGQMLWSEQSNNVQHKIDMQSYPSGIYLIQVGGKTGKIIKK